MKLLVVAAVLAACSGAKLDRTYLPPAGARSAGGTGLQAPLAPAGPAGPARAAFDGVAVEAAGPLARLSTGLGAPATAYGSANTRVGEAAFRGASQQPPGHTFDGAPQQNFNEAPQRSVNRMPQQNFNGVNLQGSNGTPQLSNTGTTQQSYNGVTQQGSNGAPQQSHTGTSQQSYNGFTQQGLNGAPQQSNTGTSQQSYNGFTQQGLNGAPQLSNTGTSQHSYNGVTQEDLNGAPQQSYTGISQQSYNAANKILGNSRAPQQSYNGAPSQQSGESSRFTQQFGADINAKPFGQASPVAAASPVAVAERAQALQERAAGIVRLDSDVGAEGFAYSFETDNGIAAEENALAAHGVQAQGAFSYRGDDGETYSVSYTADENGYRPQGAHLPTPPPIPDDILRSIEQNMKDEAAGIVDDGAYDAQRHGGGHYENVEGAAGFGGQPAQYNQNGAGIGPSGQFTTVSQQAQQAKSSYLPPEGTKPFDSSSQQSNNNGLQGSSLQYQQRPASQVSQFIAQQFKTAFSQGPSQKYSSATQQRISQQYKPNEQGDFQPNSPTHQGPQQNQATNQQRYTQQYSEPISQKSSQQPNYNPTTQGQYSSPPTQQSNSRPYNIPTNQGPSQKSNYPYTQSISQQPNVFKPQDHFNSAVTQQSNSQQYNFPSNQNTFQQSNFPKLQSAQTSTRQELSEQYNKPTNQYSTQSHSQKFTAPTSESVKKNQAYNLPPHSSVISQFSKTQTQQYNFPSSAPTQIPAHSTSLPQPITDISESSHFNSPAQNFNQQSQKFTASSSFSQFNPASQPPSQVNAYQYNPPAKSFSTPQQFNPQNNPPSTHGHYNTATQGGSSQSYNPQNQQESQQYNVPSVPSQTTNLNQYNGPSSQNAQQLTGSGQPTSSPFRQPQGSQSSPIEEPSAPSQQYDGEIYQYNKPEDPSSPARPQLDPSKGGQVSNQFGIPPAPLTPSQGSSQKYTAQSQLSAGGGGGGGGAAPGPGADNREQFGGPRAPPGFNAQTGYQY